MKFLSRISNEFIAFPIIIIAFFATRLYSILSLPIFTDEAIYTRWSQIARQDANWRFISLTDGKQPMFVWFDLVMMKFIHDPLLSGRLVSVGAGLLTLIGLYFLTFEVFRSLSTDSGHARKMAILSSLIYVIYPFALVYDRMALYDSLVATFAVWMLYFEILLVKRLRFDIAMILGFVIGGAVLTKTSGFFGIYLMPFLYLLLDFKKDFKEKALKLTGLLVVSIIISQGMYSVLRLSPYFHIISEKNTIFVHPVGEWLSYPLSLKIDFFKSSFTGLSTWFVTYFGFAFIFLTLVAVFASKKLLREKLLLLVWFAVPFGGLAVLGNNLYPRYLLFMTMPLIPLVSFGFVEFVRRLRRSFIFPIAFLIFFILPIFSSYLILTDFQNSPIPKSDKEQYISGWPAGGGVKESVQMFQELSKKKPIFIATQGTFGLMPFSYEIYLVDKPNIIIKGYWPTGDNAPEELLSKSKKVDTYMVFYQPCPACQGVGKPPANWPLTLVKEYKKSDDTYLGVYKFETE